MAVSKQRLLRSAIWAPSSRSTASPAVTALPSAKVSTSSAAKGRRSGGVAGGALALLVVDESGCLPPLNICNFRLPLTLGSAGCRESAENRPRTCPETPRKPPETAMWLRSRPNVP